MIEKLFVYPIKSCKGIEVSQLDLLMTGPRYDRMFVLVDEKGRFLSQRTVPRMCLISSYIGDCPFTGRGEKAVSIDAPGMETEYIPLLYGEKIMHSDFREREIVIHKDRCKGVDLGNEYAKWFSTFLERPCRLIRQVSRISRVRTPSSVGRQIEVSFADGYPLLVITKASLADLNQRIVAQGGTAVPLDRFRPNIVPAGSTPYEEDTWGHLKIGDVRLEGANKCVRCAITTTDQQTGKRGKIPLQMEPLKTLETYRRSQVGIEFGRNFVVVKGGTIQVGQTVVSF